MKKTIKSLQDLGELKKEIERKEQGKPLICDIVNNKDSSKKVVKKKK